MNNSKQTTNSSTSPISLAYLTDAVITSSTTTSINNSNATLVATLSSTTTPLMSQKRSQRRMSASSTSCSSSSTSSNSNNNKLATIQTSPSLATTLNQLASSSSILSTNTMHAQQSANTMAFKVVVPKSPKPQRTLCILEHVTTGLNLSINDLRAKVADLTSAVTNGYNAMAKQLLQSESCLRHLEQRISTLNKLENSYNVHLKMKDGIQNMFDAYKKSPGNQNKNLANIKNGWKDCIQKLCAIEAQTEALLGTFQFQIEKLIGFARLCPGDTYEILIKYGNSTKFKTRTKICKDNSQHWENTKFAFKITVHDLLLIRINEIKFLGKNILIGERVFDTKDLFSTTQTQRLTLNANTSGTLKLSMLITWLPFENCEESFIYYNPTQYLTMNNKNRLSSYTMTKLANNSDFINTTNTQMRSSNSSQSIVDTSINKFNNLLSAIIDTDDLESEASSCDPANSSSSSSTTSTSSSTKKTSQSQDHNDQKEALDNNNNDNNDADCTNKSPTSSNSNLDDNQLSTSLNSLSTNASSSKNEDSNNDNSSGSNDKLIRVKESPSATGDSPDTSYESIAQEVEQVLNGILDELVETQSKPSVSLALVDELLIRLDAKLDELRAHYIELNEFNEQIQNYQNLLNRLKLTTSSTDTSSTSLILDDLLQYFDFLNDNDEISSKLETKELQFDLPDDFCLFLNNCLTQANRLIDDLSELHRIQTDSSFKLTQLESVIFDKLNTETLILKNFYLVIYELNETVTTPSKSESSRLILSKILDDSIMLDTHGDDEKKLNLWLKLTESSFLLHATKLELTSNLKFKNALLGAKLLNKTTNLDLINIYQFNAVLQVLDLINEIDHQNDESLSLIDKINLDHLFNNRIYSSTILSFLIDESLLNKQINLETFMMRLKALNPIKTADILITLMWEIISDNSSSEDSLKLLINFLQLINQNDDNKIVDQSVIEYVQKKLETLCDTNYYVF